MKVVLPDNSELELPAGASGLDAARAIGPKLAEQAVLVRVGGRVQDLRQPLADGDKIQLLTTRDREDPDALAVLRHSLGAPARRGRAPPLPGREDRDRAADRERLLLRLRLPRAGLARRISSGSRRRSTGAEGGPQPGRARRSRVTRRTRASTRTTSRTRSSWSRPPRGTSPSTRSRSGSEFTDLCRGPHLQDSKPIKALKLTGLAGAYWRGDSDKPAADPHLRHRLLPQEDLDAHLARLEEAREARPPRARARSSTSSRFDEHSARIAVLAPEGDGDLQRARGSAPRARTSRRGYAEVKTPLIYDKALWQDVGPLGEVPREHVPHPAGARRRCTGSSR